MRKRWREVHESKRELAEAKFLLTAEIFLIEPYLENSFVNMAPKKSFAGITVAASWCFESNENLPVTYFAVIEEKNLCLSHKYGTRLKCDDTFIYLRIRTDLYWSMTFVEHNHKMKVNKHRIVELPKAEFMKNCWTGN